MNGSEKGNFPNNELGFSFPWQNYEARRAEISSQDVFAVISPRFLKIIVARLSGFLLAPFLEYTPRRPPFFFFCKRVFQA